MSLLAEPRRKKVRIGPDPQNCFWKNDESKFGKRMLEKMGWLEGKGLGSSQQGISNPIKLRANGGSKGLGHSGSSDDAWTVHNDDFAALLTALNKTSPAVSPGEASSSTKSKSLEESSKMSRARVHYHRFTRGKDLSKRSSEDIECILGKRKKQNRPSFDAVAVEIEQRPENSEESVESDTCRNGIGSTSSRFEGKNGIGSTSSRPEDKNGIGSTSSRPEATGTDENSSETPTALKTSSESMQEYFQRKMAEKLNSATKIQISHPVELRLQKKAEEPKKRSGVEW